MDGVSVAPAAGHAWLAKVLAGDPLACMVLALARALPDADLDAFILRVEQIGAEVPADASAARQDLGRTSS